MAQSLSQEGLSGLKDRSRHQTTFLRKSPKEIEERIIELRKVYPAWRDRKVKDAFGLFCSTNLISMESLYSQANLFSLIMS
jgi:hypothetical protein